MVGVVWGFAGYRPIGTHRYRAHCARGEAHLGPVAVEPPRGPVIRSREVYPCPMSLGRKDVTANWSHRPTSERPICSGLPRCRIASGVETAGLGAAGRGLFTDVPVRWCPGESITGSVAATSSIFK